MKVTFEIQQVDALATLKNYAESKNSTLDEIIDKALVKIALNLKSREENTYSVEEIYNAKLESYPINDYIKQKLKFQYLLLKDGTVACNQFGKLKEMKYSFDTGSGAVYVYLLLQGCPNKADIATLQTHSIRINLEELYNQVYGRGTFEKYVIKNVMNKIAKSQEEWKKKKGAK